jgi:hypothetical protein
MPIGCVEIALDDDSDMQRAREEERRTGGDRRDMQAQQH